jgi:hypothetical protein
MSTTEEQAAEIAEIKRDIRDFIEGARFKLGEAKYLLGRIADDIAADVNERAKSALSAALAALREADGAVKETLPPGEDDKDE